MTEIKTYTGGVAVDDRGTVSFVNDFNFAGVKRFYQVENHRKGFIRAWHGHEREAKYVYVASGTILLGLINMYNHEKTKHILSARKPQVLYIPPGYYNGFKNLEDDTKVIFFSTSTIEEAKDDDIRQRYDNWPWDIWDEEYR